MTMTVDVIIIGAGLAGTTAAYVLASKGIETLTIDRNECYPEAFRAEKIEPHQASLFRKFGLLDYRMPLTVPIGDIDVYKDRKVSRVNTIEQYGFNYTNTVNNFRKVLRKKSKILCERITNIELGDTIQTVTTVENEYTCRLVILATGGSDTLLKKIGIKRIYDKSMVTLSFAFDLQLESGNQFPFNGFNYTFNSTKNKLDYITLFKIGDTMRANIFTQWLPASDEFKQFRESPLESMKKHFPHLITQIGKYKIVTKVQAFPTTFYRLSDISKPGIVIIGDEFQSVSPTTGTGLDKVTVDVDRLCNHYIPNWLKTPKMDANKITQFYDDTNKRYTDYQSMKRWIDSRNRHYGFFKKYILKLYLRTKVAFHNW